MTEAELVKVVGKFEEIYDEVRDLIIALKGYNGFPGLLKEFGELKNDFWIYTESKKDTPTNNDIKELMEWMKVEIKSEREISTKACNSNSVAIEALEKQVTLLLNRPGQNALKWANRILIALISAAAIGFFGLWLDNRRIIMNYVKAPTSITSPNTSTSPP